MRCISLLTDFGLQDGFVGVMHAVILDIAPSVQVIDLTHQIEPQNIMQAALILADSYRYFPSGSVHVAVVDPGVGTGRAAMAAKVGDHYFVSPDNGILTRVFLQAEREGETIQAVRLENRKYWLAEISQTFHGRDIFAPTAAHLANEVALTELGSRLDSPVRLDIPSPVRSRNGWQAEVLYCDHFGNLVTNLDREQIKGGRIKEVWIGGAVIQRILSTYGEADSGTLIALFDSGGHLSISRVNGNAAASLRLHAGAQVEIITMRDAE